jgi:CheY-like chemotaxis protein
MDSSTVILIVEDEALIALDLALAVEEAGELVLGPAASSAEALQLIKAAQDAEVSISGAVLDANLLDGDVSPVALRLWRSGVPIVIHSAVGVPEPVKAVAPTIPWVRKPALATKVVEDLCKEIAHSASVNVFRL